VSQLDASAGLLTGRAGELDFLEGFFRQAAVSGGALLLSGDPGVGKTALLNVLADSVSASGTMVLRVAGMEFEGQVSCRHCPPLGFPRDLTRLVDFGDKWREGGCQDQPRWRRSRGH